MEFFFRVVDEQYATYPAYACGLFIAAADHSAGLVIATSGCLANEEQIIVDAVS